jgi:PiT family inorganic phosphate transporter
MMTVGDSLLTLTPLGAFVVVVSHSLVLFIFSSTALEAFLASHGLPTIPLLPVSGSQAVIGSVVGIGLLQGIKGIRQIRWNVLVGIASGWITTPLLAAVMGFVLLFVVQNVFGQQVYQAEVNPRIPAALERAYLVDQPSNGSGGPTNSHGEKQADSGEA